MASKIRYTKLMGQPEQGPSIITLTDYTTPVRRNGEWRAYERFVDAREAIAAFVGMASRSGVLVARDPLILRGKQPLLEYKLPYAYSDQRLYGTRTLLWALTWSVAEKEEASRYNGLAKYHMRPVLDLPDRVLASNQEVVQYVIAFLLGLDTLPEIPNDHMVEEKHVSAAIALALEEILDHDYAPREAKARFEEMVREVLTPDSRHRQ